MNSTKVFQTYTADLNLSVTKRKGRVTKVTTWTTRVPGSTEVIVSNTAIDLDTRNLRRK